MITVSRLHYYVTVYKNFIKISLHVVFISFFGLDVLLDRDIYLLNNLRAMNVELNIRWLFMKFFFLMNVFRVCHV